MIMYIINEQKVGPRIILHGSLPSRKLTKIRVLLQSNPTAPDRIRRN
jgi:hypothetical protein